MYERASIPTINKKKIYQKVQKLVELKKSRVKEFQEDKRRGSATVVGKWRQKSKNGKMKVRLQDVLCAYFPVAHEKNVPPLEKEFLEDQKSDRKMSKSHYNQE